MKADDYQALAMRTNDGLSNNRLEMKIDSLEGTPIEIGLMLQASLGLSGEMGELNDMIKKWIFHEKEMDWEHFKKEIGDICWYIAAMCKAVGINFSDVLEKNVDKLKSRYPEGFDVFRANHRESGDV